MILIKKFITILVLSGLIFSCQPVEIMDDIVFNNNLLPKISLNAGNKNVNQLYETNYVDPYIDHSIKTSPLVRVNNWLNDNIHIFGTQNDLAINIIDASLIRIKKLNDNEKKYNEKEIYFYEVNFFLEYILYDNAGTVLATTKVYSKRSTTSSKFISLNEQERIIDSIILDALIDLSSKSEELLKLHMFQYVL